MRDRYDQSDFFDTSDTLERLQQALTTLERRVENTVHPGQRGAVARDRDIAAIRERQRRLDEGRRAPRSHRSSDRRTEDLRREISRLRDDVGREIRTSAGGFDALRDELRSVRAAAGNVEALRDEVRSLQGGATALDALRGDVESLKTQVTALAREESVRDLTDRWSVIEHEIADLPQTLASRDDLSAVAGRLDSMQKAMDALPRSAQLDTLEQHVHALAGAVEQVARQKAHAAPPALDDLDARLDEISRAIAAIPSAGAAGLESHAVERIEARIAALATQLDQVAGAQAPVDYDARFSELADRIEGLRIGVAPGTVSGEAMDALMTRIDAMAEALDQLVRSEGVSDDQASILAAELEERLAAIDAQLRETGLLAERSVEQVVRSVDDRMADIARRIEASRQAEADLPSVAQFERRLDEIAAMLASGAQAQPPADMAALEAQLADIAASLTSDRIQPIDDETIWTAARTAAEEVATRVSAQGEQRMPEALDQLTDDLRALENLARDTDGRNAKTFEAIHDTLLQVVDHLASLEEKVKQVGTQEPTVAPPPGQPADITRADEMLQIDEAPLLVADDVEPAPAAREPRAAASPAEAAAEAALAALGETHDARDRTAAEAAPGARGLFKSVADRIPLGLGRGGTETDAIAREGAEPDDAGPPVIDDQPIEPVSEKMALADIMARVRTERAAPAAQGAAPRTDSQAAEVGKSDFIAAARRAAQAAAADASLMASGDRGETKGVSGSIGGLVSGRRRPILMATGAILLAILAIPLVRGFIAPGSENVATDATPPAAITETAPDAEPMADAEATAELEPEAAADPVRDVAAGTGPAIPDTDDAAATIEPESVAFGRNTDAEPRPDAGVDQVDAQTASFDPVPTEIGPIALREAAADGDPKALHVIADRIASSRGDDPAALSEALTWYERSADMGYAPAQYRLGNLLEKGIGTKRDIAAAKTWYQLAAEQGNASAMHNLAVLFASGGDGTPDFDSAARWFQRAAELGVRDSQYNLGILSAKGQGVPQDLGESYKWFALAARSGDEDAAAKRDDVANVLRPDQLEQARGATALWKAKPVDAEVNVVSVPDAWQTDATRTAAAPPLSDEEMKRAVANIQAILNDQGYDAGPVDGIMGERTRQAIIAFQRDNGFAATGNVDQALVEQLLAIANAEG